MNKKIVALAVAAAFAIPAAASAQVTLFGQVKYEVGLINDGDDINAVHSTLGTRIGIHGSEDLGGGLTGIFRFQGGLGGVNAGMSNTEWKMNEENWVGLRGGFGTVLIGRHDTAIKKTAGNQFRFFVDSQAEPSLAPGAAGQRAEGVHYTTPNIQGFTGYLTLEPVGNKLDTYVAVGAAYQAGPFWIGGAVESAPKQPGGVVAPEDDFDVLPSPFISGTVKNDIGPDQTNYQVGVKWNFGPGEIGFLWQARNDGDDNIFLVPVRYNVTPNISLRAAVKHVDPDDPEVDDYTNFGVGASYNFSRRTEAFAHVWSDDKAGQTTTNALGASDDVHFGLGVRHSF